MLTKNLTAFFVLLVIVALLFSLGGKEKVAFALSAVAEWQTGDFSIEI